MARRKKSGLGVGQLLTLTFGFLLASVIIFVFGVWVGRGVSRQRDRDDRPVVVKKVEKPGAVGAAPTAVTTVGAEDRPYERPTRPRFVATATPKAVPTRTPAATRSSTKRPASTHTPRRGKPTVAAKPTVPTKTRKPAPAAKATWTVQATATNDQVQAVITKRRLSSQGYDAFTVQAEVGGTTWYRVQVGKFKDKKSAEKIATQLRANGMEAAYVERLR